MQTILNEWRNQERQELTALYDKLESLITEGALINMGHIDDLCHILGIPRHRITIADNQKSAVLAITDEAISISTEEGNREAELAQIDAWRRELLKKADWNRHDAIDDHVIHFHIKRIAGDLLAETYQEEFFFMRPFSKHLEVLETDDLTIHILSSKCHSLCESLIVDNDTTPERRQEVLETGLKMLLENGPTWARLPGMKIRGIQIHANLDNPRAKIEGNTLSINTVGLPETFKMIDFVGKPIHEIMEIEGYHNDHVTVSQVTSTKPNEMTMRINRYVPQARRRLILK